MSWDGVKFRERPACRKRHGTTRAGGGVSGSRPPSFTLKAYVRVLAGALGSPRDSVPRPAPRGPCRSRRRRRPARGRGGPVAPEAGRILVRRTDSPTPRSNPTTSCSSSGCTRPRHGVWRPAHRGPHRQGRRARSSRGSSPTADSTSIRSGPAELSATVKAYAALKLAGLPAESEPHDAARASASCAWAASRRPTATSRST